AGSRGEGSVIAIDGDSTVGGITTGLAATRRRGAGRRPAGVGAGALLGAARFVAAFRAGAFLVAGRRAVRCAVVAAGREDAARAICCTCLVSPSRLFNARSRSA